MTAYYNEHDPFAAAWLRELIKSGHIADGIVDETDIQDVKPSDLDGFTQCHFFAGIGGWSHALRLAGWPDDKSVWTGSAPCQPFSTAGAGKGVADERHLWPHFHWLIKQCRPGVIFGEQVESAINHGWLDLVQDDLEGEGYAFGAVGIPAAGVGAPHIRQRLFWVADTTGQQKHQEQQGPTEDEGGWGSDGSSRCGVDCGMADADCQRYDRIDALLRQEQGNILETSRGRPTLLVADADNAGPQGRAERRDGPGERITWSSGVEHQRGGTAKGFWSASDWLGCRDGKWRPVEPGTFPLVDGTAHSVGRMRSDKERISEASPRKDQGSRVGRLRGYGNAIVPQVAAEFIKAYGEIA